MMVVICGGRGYCDAGSVQRVVESLPVGTVVVSGGASGADRLASCIAEELGYDQIICPANWERHGKAAGPIRNRLMLDLGVQAVYAFPGGKGTADMCAIAERAGIPVHRIGWEAAA